MKYLSRSILRILRGPRTPERKRGDDQGVGAKVCAELGALSYVVEPRDIVDESGFVRFPRYGNPFLLMRRADARPAYSTSHPHRISAVRPEQEIHREENWRVIERA